MLQLGLVEGCLFDQNDPESVCMPRRVVAEVSFDYGRLVVHTEEDQPCRWWLHISWVHNATPRKPPLEGSLPTLPSFQR